MRPFDYLRVDRIDAAIHAAQGDPRRPPTLADAQFLAGGTTLLDLMKRDTVQPRILIDINDLRPQFAGIRTDGDGLWLGAFTRMSEAAEHPLLLRDYPVIAQSLQLAASAQLRNMATLGGNVLQRTRCQYFRDPSWSACNKRRPGSGCAALDGVNRKHAVLGTSPSCIASYPGDFAQTLVALDAKVRIAGIDGERWLRFEQLHREPDDTPERETVLASSDLILGFLVPAGPWTRRSLYMKVRDRASYEFALVSAAVAMALDRSAGDGRTIEEVRIGLGGVATRPWRAREAEAVLRGQALTEARAEAAADAALDAALTRAGNAYKPRLARHTLVHALMTAAAMEVADDE